MASAGRSKFVKKGDTTLTPLEERVAAEIAALEASHATLKTELKPLRFTAAREVEVDAGRKAILLFVPFPQLKDFRKIHSVLVEELQKKLSGYHVLIIAARTMISPTTWSRGAKYTGVRSRTRTLKSVQENLLDDIVYPFEITGKRLRMGVDGSRLLKVFLNKQDTDGKADTFRTVYKTLTGKEIEFVAH